MRCAFLKQNRPTKRAPDAGESGAIQGIFLRLSIFPVGRRPATHPSAGNAIRWAAAQSSQIIEIQKHLSSTHEALNEF